MVAPPTDRERVPTMSAPRRMGTSGCDDLASADAPSCRSGVVTATTSPPLKFVKRSRRTTVEGRRSNHSRTTARKAVPPFVDNSNMAASLNNGADSGPAASPVLDPPSPPQNAARFARRTCRPRLGSLRDEQLTKIPHRKYPADSDAVLGLETPLGASPDVNVLTSDVEDFMTFKSILTSPMQLVRLVGALFEEFFSLLFWVALRADIRQIRTNVATGAAVTRVSHALPWNRLKVTPGSPTSSASTTVSEISPSRTAISYVSPMRWLDSSSSFVETQVSQVAEVPVLSDESGAALSMMVPVVANDDRCISYFFPYSNHEELWWFFGSASPKCTTTSLPPVLPSEEHRTRNLAIIIPGNPGIVGAYSHFASCLGQELASDVCVIGHRGHHSRIGVPSEHFSMHYQLQHHSSRVKALTSPQGGYERIDILGHSIGAHLVLQGLDPDVICDKLETGVVLLMPTVSRFSPKSYWILRILALPPMSYLASAAFKILNYIFPACHPDQPILATLNSGYFLQNIISLLRCELRELPDQIPTALLKQWSNSLNKRGKRVLVLYAATDPYISPETQSKMGENLGGEAAVVSWERLRHSFVLDPTECRLASKLFMAWRSGVAPEDLMAAGCAADPKDARGAFDSNVTLSLLRQLFKIARRSSNGRSIPWRSMAGCLEESIIVDPLKRVVAAVTRARTQFSRILFITNWAWIPRIGSLLTVAACAKRSSSADKEARLASRFPQGRFSR